MNGPWKCSSCGETHEDMPLSFACDFPDMYANMSELERDTRAVASSDQCIVEEIYFFIRGTIELPIVDRDDLFLWGCWASLTEGNFAEIADLWYTEGREKIVEDTFAARLANSLPGYSPATLNIRIRLQLRPLGERPVFLIVNDDHPIFFEQADGLTSHEASIKAAAVMDRPNRLGTRVQ